MFGRSPLPAQPLRLLGLVLIGPVGLVACTATSGDDGQGASVAITDTASLEDPGVTDQDRCEDAMLAVSSLSGSVEAMQAANQPQWPTVELLFQSSFTMMAIALDGTTDAQLQAATSSTGQLQARLETLDPPTYEEKLEYARDVLDLAIDVSMRCLELTEGAG